MADTHDLDRSDPFVRWFALVLRQRRAVALLVAALTVVAGLTLTRVSIGSTLQKLFFGDSPDYARYLEQSQRFGNDEHVLIGIPVDDPLALDLLKRLATLDEAVADIETGGFTGAHSIGVAQRIEGDDGGIQVRDWSEGGTLEAALDDPGVAGVLVGRDGRSVSVLVELAVDPDRTGQEGLANLDLLDDTLAEHGFSGDHVHRAGFPVLLVEMLHLAWDNLFRLLPMSVLALLLTVMAVFKRILPAIVSVGISGLAMIWTMALSSLIDPVFSIMVTAVPLVVVVVGFSDVIHLWSAWEQERLLGRPREESILASASDVGRACLLTSVTTFVGFVSLSFVPTPMFRQMGVTLGIGVALALVLAMTLVPVLLSYGLDDDAIEKRSAAPSKSAWGRGVVALDHALDAIIEAMSTLSSRRPWPVVVAFLVLMGAAGAGALQMNIDAELISRVDDGHKLQIDARWLSERFVGDNALQVFVDSGEPDGLLDPTLLSKLADFQDAVTALPSVDQSVSLVDGLRSMHDALGAGDGTTLPDTRAAVAQELLLFEMSGGRDLDRLVDFDRQRAAIHLRLQSGGMRATRDIAHDITAMGQDALGSAVSVEATSLSALMGAWIERIIDGQVRGISFSVGVVTLLMVMGLRSLRLGLVSMLPNLLPLIWLGGYLGLAWGDVDTDTAVIAMLAIGIGVDDTIHFLMRYRVEAARCETRAEALQRTYAFAGRAIVMTTVVLVVGFLPCALSDYFSLRILGTLLPMVLIFAVLADLLMVPAMVRVGWLALPTKD